MTVPHTLGALLAIADNLHDAWIINIAVDEKEAAVVIFVDGIECLDEADVDRKEPNLFRAKVTFTKARFISKNPARSYINKDIIRCFCDAGTMEVVTSIGNFSIDYDDSIVEIVDQS